MKSQTSNTIFLRMPRKKLLNRVRQIIVAVGDECAVFDLNNKEEFEKTKLARDQIMKRLKNKIKKECIKRNDNVHASKNQQNDFAQKQSFQLDLKLDQNEPISFPQSFGQIQTKVDEKEMIYDLFSSNPSQLYDGIDWMNLFF